MIPSIVLAKSVADLFLLSFVPLAETFLDQKWNKTHDVTGFTGFIQLASKAHLQCVTRVCQIQADTCLLYTILGGGLPRPTPRGSWFFLLQMCLYVLPQVAGHWKTGH